MFEPFFASEAPRNYVMAVPATHYCSGGCGGGRTDPDLIWYYNYGDCMSMETCKCKLKENKTEVGELCATYCCMCFNAITQVMLDTTVSRFSAIHSASTESV